MQFGVAVFAILLVPGMGQSSAGSSMDHINMGMMQMGTMDIHSHHRCCQHDMWHGMMYENAGYLKNGSMTPTVMRNSMMVDYDYTRKMERINITSHESANDTTSHSMVWKDYNNKMQYTWVDGQCYATQSDDMMIPPCISPEDMYGGALTIGSGADTIKAHSWHGMKNHLMISYTVTEGDCTPVTMSVIGDLEDGTKTIQGFLFAEVKQGMLSGKNVFDMPMECKNAQMSPIGK